MRASTLAIACAFAVIIAGAEAQDFSGVCLDPTDYDGSNQFTYDGTVRRANDSIWAVVDSTKLSRSTCGAAARIVRLTSATIVRKEFLSRRPESV